MSSAFSFFQIFGKYSPAKAIQTVVCGLYGLVFVIDSNYRSHRTEDFNIADAFIWFIKKNHRRLEVSTNSRDCLPA